MKIKDDAYYTPKEIALKCVKITLSHIPKGNITEVVEPSIGNGSFITSLLDIDLGIDICPKVIDKSINVVCDDFLAYNFSYKQGRLIIGNPPYGRCLNLAQKFYKKSVEIADYIGFILPISQLNNTSSMYQFDLVSSTDLGMQLYTDRNLHCCFNLYRRPINGLNSKVNLKSKNIKIIRQDSKNYDDADYDLRMCYWGDGSAGKILNNNEHYSAEYKIKILNDKFKSDIINVLSTFDWKQYLSCIAMRKIQQFHIIDVLRKNISNFE